MIAVVIPEINSFFYSRILASMQAVIGDKYLLAVMCSNNSSKIEKDIVSKLNPSQIKCLIISQSMDTEDCSHLVEAKKRGIKTSIDLVSEHSDRYKLVIPCLEYVDNLIVNELEAGAMAGIEPTLENLPAIADKLLSYGVSERVIIHSPSLGIVKTRNSLTVLPSYKLPEGFIKGTAGAGDAFCSGALLGIYEEKSDEEILEYATLAAISNLRAVDGTSSVDELDKLKRELGNLPRQTLKVNYN